MSRTPPPPKRPASETVKPGRKPDPRKAELRKAETAIRLAQDGLTVDRAARCDAIADALVAAIGDGEFTLTSALDAARVAKILSEISRLDRGQATQIVGGGGPVPTSVDERRNRFLELREKAINVGSVEHSPVRAVEAG